MDIVKYLKNYSIHCIIIFCLLICKTALILTTPYITSNIINIGLQQKGLENSYSPYYSPDTYQQLKKLVSNNTQLLDNAYNYNEELQLYILDPNISNKDEIDSILVYPMAYLQSISNKTETSYKDYKNLTEEGMAKQTSIQKVINELNELNIDIFEIQLNYLITQGAILLVLTLFLALIAYISQLWIAYVSVSIGKEKREQYFNKIIQFSYEELNKFGEASLITRATNDIRYITYYIESFLYTGLTAPISMIVGLIFAIITAPKLTWIIVLAAIAIIVAAFIMIRCAAPIFSKMQWLIELITLKAREIISGQYVIRSFNNEDIEEVKFNKTNQNLKETNLFLGRLTAVITTLLNLGFNIVAIIILLFGGFYINTGEIQVGNIIAFVSYSSIILSSISSLGIFLGAIPRAKVCIKRIDRVISTTPKIQSIENLKINKVESIKFKNVCFSYGASSNIAVKNISFEVTTGETLGIIGTIGSGKTTIANLLLRLEDASKGEILVNNTNITKYNLENYKEMFGFSPQNSFLFKGSYRENIGFGKNKNINKYINIACLNDLIKSLEHGVDSNIEQHGQNISGGQQQRVSIARALATEASVFIFDDCFSALDYKTENKILNNIYANFPNSIKLIISSRLSNVKKADKIIVLDEGKIVGYGKHDKLIKDCTEYIKMYKYQYSEVDLKEA